MKFRNKPIIIEAFRWTGDETQACDPEWIVAAIEAGQVAIFEGCVPLQMEIKTSEGMMIALPVDFIIKGIAGEIYPCKPDIFVATYEPVEESEGL